MNSTKRFQATKAMYEKAITRQSKYGKIIEEMIPSISTMQGLELYIPTSLWKKSGKTISNKLEKIEDLHKQETEAITAAKETLQDKNIFLTEVSASEKSDQNLQDHFSLHDTQSDVFPQQHSSRMLDNADNLQKEYRMKKNFNIHEDSVQEYVTADSDGQVSEVEPYEYEDDLRNHEVGKGLKVANVNIGTSNEVTHQSKHQSTLQRTKRRRKTISDSKPKLILVEEEKSRTRPTELLLSKRIKPIARLERELHVPLGVKDRLRLVENERIQRLVRKNEEKIRNELEDELIPETAPPASLPDPRKFEELRDTSRDDVFERAMQTTTKDHTLLPRTTFGTFKQSNEGQIHFHTQGSTVYNHFHDLTITMDAASMPTFIKEQTIIM